MSGEGRSTRLFGDITNAADRTSVATRICISSILHSREVSFIISALLIYCSLYITFISVLERPFLHPFAKDFTNFNASGYDKAEALLSSSVLKTSEISKIITTIHSLFVIWLFSVIIGSLFGLVHLPPLLGPLLVGILCKNASFFAELLYVDENWNSFLRRSSLTVILIRAGVGLDIDALMKTKSLICRMGVISSICEATAIVLLAILILPLSMDMNFLLAIVLTATSPAVIVPTMLEFMKRSLGTVTGTSSAIIASSTVDNVLCVIAYNVAASLVFSSVLLRYEFSVQFTGAVLGVIFGIIGGYFLTIHPHYNSYQVHVVRALLLFTICFAMNYGSSALGTPSLGVISTVLISLTASIGWKKHKTSTYFHEAEIFAFVWDCFAVQILFSLIGYEFQIKQLTLSIFLLSLAVIGIGVVIRIISAYFLCSNLNMPPKEQLFFAASFISKGTLQAALIPQLLEKCKESGDSDRIADGSTILAIGVIAILIMAPLGQLILQIFGPLLLTFDDRKNNENKLQALNLPPEILSQNNMKDYGCAMLHHIEIKTA